MKGETTELRTNKRAAANSGFALYGVKCLNIRAVLQINFSSMLKVLCPEIPHERKAVARYNTTAIIPKTKTTDKHNNHENFKNNPGASVDHHFNEVNGAAGKFDHNEQIRPLPDDKSYHGF